MISTNIQIRYSDCDMGGHVHNAVYLNYFEIARIGFFLAGLGEKWDWKKDGLIIRKNTIEYFVPTFIEDRINIEVACNHIGGKSFTLTYAVKNQDGILKAQGESVVVCFDYTKNSTIEIPEVMKNLLNKHLTQ